MGKVLNINRTKKRELQAMTNRLALIKDSMNPLHRFEIEDMIYRLNIGSPIDLASEIFIIKLYKINFLQ